MAKQIKKMQLLKPFPIQEQIINDPHRFKVLACGRRFSKTTIGKFEVVNTALNEKEEVYWLAPTYKNSTKIWRDMKRTFRNLTVWKSESERTLELYGGGILSVWTSNNYEAMRGGSPRTVIFDEAAMMHPDVWDAVIRPALSDKRGKALFLSTPRGRNWFYDLYKEGLDDKDGLTKSWRYPSWYNPYIPKSEFAYAKKKRPEKLFAQEYEAEFLLDEADVFFGVSQVCLLLHANPYDGRFVFGVDLGRKNDYTVVTVWDTHAKSLVAFDRFNRISWTAQKDRIIRYFQEWGGRANIHKVMIEENYNDYFADDLKKSGLPVKKFYTSRITKGQIIQQLSVAIQNKKVAMVNDRILLNEFQAFAFTMTEHGNIKYSAPQGYHDDIVMSAAIGYQGVVTSNRIGGSILPSDIFN